MKHHNLRRRRTATGRKPPRRNYTPRIESLESRMLLAQVDMGVVEATSHRRLVSTDTDNVHNVFFETSQTATSFYHRIEVIWDATLGDVDVFISDSNSTFDQQSAILRQEPGVFAASLLGEGAEEFLVDLVVTLDDSNTDRQMNVDFYLTPPRTTDPLEPNDQYSQAFAIANNRSQGRVNDLSLHSAQDVDYFWFQLTEPGASDQFLRLVSDPLSQAPRMRVIDQQGAIWRETSTTNAQIDLDAVPAGFYFIVVEGGTNPYYYIDYNVGSWQPGDSILIDQIDLQSRNRTAVVATPIAFNGFFQDSTLTLHDAADDDWFTFQTLTVGDVANEIVVEMNSELGDIDLQLFDAFSPAPIRESTNAGADVERISLAGLPAGRYFLKVYGRDEMTVSPGYRLRVLAPTLMPDVTEANVDAAYPLNELSTELAVPLLNIHAYFDTDEFEFSIPDDGFSGVEVTISSPDPDATFTTTLLHSASGSQESTTDSGTVVSQSDKTGTFKLSVTGFTLTEYDLIITPIDATPSLPPDDWENNPIGMLSMIPGIPVTVSGLSIHTTGDIDTIPFQLTGDPAGQDTISIQTDDADVHLAMALYRVDGEQTLVLTSSPGKTEIDMDGLPAGSYELVVFSGDQTSIGTYTLNWTTSTVGDVYESGHGNDTILSATDLGAFGGTRRIDRPDQRLSLHSGQDRDWFRFELQSHPRSGHRITITNDDPEAVDALYLKLWEIDEHGVPQPLTGTNRFGNEGKLSLRNLSAGVYYAEVSSLDGRRVDSYGLEFRLPGADRLEGNTNRNDTRDNATELWSDPRTLILNGKQYWNGMSIDSATDVDWYRFTTTSNSRTGHNIYVNYRRRDGDLQVLLHQPDGTIIRESSGAWDSEYISLADLPAGTYFVGVRGVDGSTNPNYSLSINAPDTVAASKTTGRLEPNNSRGQAYAIGKIDGLKIFGSEQQPLQIGDNDEDWYRIDVTSDARYGDFAAIVFNHQAGDLEMTLFDDHLDSIAQPYATGLGNLHFVSLDRSVGTYYLKVHGRYGATNPLYYLAVRQQRPTAPDFIDSQQLAAARSVRSALSGLSLEAELSQAVRLGDFDDVRPLQNLSLHDGDIDTFEFTIDQAGRSGDAFIVQANDSVDGLTTQLRDAQGNIVRHGRAITDGIQIQLAGLPAGFYSLEIFGTQTRYDLVARSASSQLNYTNSSQSAAIDLGMQTGLTTRTFADHSLSEGWFKF
ncbi:MAG: hypothetical protein R3C05_16625 [Pirellulaceae bacterium]